MKRRTTLAVIALAGAFTLSPFIHDLWGDTIAERLFSRELLSRLGWIVLPTLLFTAACFLAHRVGRLQVFIALAAVGDAALVGGMIWYEVQHHITGRGTFGVTPGTFAVLVAPAPAAAVLVMALVAAARRSLASR